MDNKMEKRGLNRRCWLRGVGVAAGMSVTRGVLLPCSPCWGRTNPKEQKKEPPKEKPPADDPSGSFPELDLDDSDSFAAELEDL